MWFDSVELKCFYDEKMALIISYNMLVWYVLFGHPSYWPVLSCFGLIISTVHQVITGKCSYILSSDGSSSSFGRAEVNRLVNSVIEPMALEGLRTIGIAYRDFDSEPNWDDETNVLSDLTLIMIAGFRGITICITIFIPGFYVCFCSFVLLFVRWSVCLFDYFSVFLIFSFFPSLSLSSFLLCCFFSSSSSSF